MPSSVSGGQTLAPPGLLLEAALIDSTDIAAVINTEGATFGEHLAGLVAQTFDDPLTTAMTNLAAADPDAQGSRDAGGEAACGASLDEQEHEQ